MQYILHSTTSRRYENNEEKERYIYHKQLLILHKTLNLKQIYENNRFYILGFLNKYNLIRGGFLIVYTIKSYNKCNQHLQIYKRFRLSK